MCSVIPACDAWSGTAHQQPCTSAAGDTPNRLDYSNGMRATVVKLGVLEASGRPGSKAHTKSERNAIAQVAEEK